MLGLALLNGILRSQYNITDNELAETTLIPAAMELRAI